jgi:FkbM family methyltransferase
LEKICAFEPSPLVLDKLRSNLAMNNCENVEIHELACTDHDGEVEFFLGAHHHQSSLHREWAQGGTCSAKVWRARGVRVDSFFLGRPEARWPDFIKMDIEGGGTFALPGCELCISKVRPFFLIESHTPDEDRAISNLLLGHDYSAYRMNDRRWVEEPQDTYPNTAGVWGTLLLAPTEEKHDLHKVGIKV